MFANFFGLRHWQLISSAPTVIYQENSRLFSKQMWQISNPIILNITLDKIILFRIHRESTLTYTHTSNLYVHIHTIFWQSGTSPLWGGLRVNEVWFSLWRCRQIWSGIRNITSGTFSLSASESHYWENFFEAAAAAEKQLREKKANGEPYR